MSERDACVVTYREYLLRREAYEKEIINRWEMVRWLGWNARILTPELKNPPRRPQDVFRLPNDIRQTEIYTISDYEISELKRIGLIKE